MLKVKKALPKRLKSSSLVLALPAAGAVSSLPTVSASGLILGAPLALTVGSLAYGLGEEFNRKDNNRKFETPTNRETVTASDNTRVARPMIFPESRITLLTMAAKRGKNKGKVSTKNKGKVITLPVEQTDSTDVTQVNLDKSETQTNLLGSASNGKNNLKPEENPKKDNSFKDKLQKAKERVSNIIKSKGAIVTGVAALVGAADYGRIVTENSYGNNLDWLDMILPNMLMPVLESGLSSETLLLRELERLRRKTESLNNLRERIRQLKLKSRTVNNTPQLNTEQTNFEEALRSIINDADSLTK